MLGFLIAGLWQVLAPQCSVFLVSRGVLAAHLASARGHTINT